MKKIKAAAIAAIICAFTATAYAELDLSTSSDTLTISGNSARANSETVCMILNEGVSYNDFVKGAATDKILYFYQTSTDSDGGYRFDFNLSDEMDYGNYVVIVDDGEYKEYTTYTHVAEEDRELYEVVTLLNEAKNSDTVKKILKANEDLLDINKSYSESQWNAISKRLLSYCGKLTLDNIDNYIEKALDAGKQKETSGGGGGGGGGGGASAVVVGNYNTVTATPQPTYMPETPTTGFDDVSDSHYARNAINKLVEMQILSGVGNNRFEPDREVKREEFVHMLCKAFNIKSDTNMDFEDVAEDAWYYDSVKSCYGAGIIKGEEINRFGVGASLTRQDACVMIYRIIGEKATSAVSEYADKAMISDYAVEAVDVLSGLSVIKGMGNNCFEPLATLTRAQAATIIYNVIENVISI